MEFPEISADADMDEEVISTQGLLMTKVFLDHSTECWKPTLNNPTFGRVSLNIRQRDQSYVIHVSDPESDELYADVPLNDLKDYVIKTRVWHEMTSTNGQQMALYLSAGEGLSKFTTILATTLRTLGKYDRLKSPGDLINNDELSHQVNRIVLIRTLSLQDLHQPQPQPVLRRQQQQQEQQQQQQEQQRQQQGKGKFHTLPSRITDANQHKLAGPRRRANETRSEVLSCESPATAANGRQNAGFNGNDPSYDAIYSEPYDHIRPGEEQCQRPSTLTRNRVDSYPATTTPAIPPRNPVLSNRPTRSRVDSTPPPVSSTPLGTVSPVGPWRCGRCRLDNVDTSYRCENCQSVRSDAWQCPDLGRCKRRLNSLRQRSCPECRAWQCEQCTSVNFRSSVTCTVCNCRS